MVRRSVARRMLGAVAGGGQDAIGYLRYSMPATVAKPIQHSSIRERNRQSRCEEDRITTEVGAWRRLAT